MKWRQLKSSNNNNNNNNNILSSGRRTQARLVRHYSVNTVSTASYTKHELTKLKYNKMAMKWKCEWWSGNSMFKIPTKVLVSVGVHIVAMYRASHFVQWSNKLGSREFGGHSSIHIVSIQLDHLNFTEAILAVRVFTCKSSLFQFTLVYTAQSSYASAVLRFVILSVCPSVCPSHACFVMKQKNTLPIFW